ncbi:hypothetical protein SESBI_35767 [Sesbania bispinosa]|nr:hypothetical protein SESBI_35767 [Sesbania bispinosa]
MVVDESNKKYCPWNYSLYNESCRKLIGDDGDGWGREWKQMKEHNNPFTC